MNGVVTKTIKTIMCVLLFLTILVIFAQWYMINKPEEIVLIEHGENQIYAYEKGSRYLMPKTKMKPALQVLRRTENTWTVRVGILQKTYVRKGDNTFAHLSEMKELYHSDKKIAILHIATGEDVNFWNRFYHAMERYFLPKNVKTYFLFTDHDYLPVKKNVIKIHQDKLVGADRSLNSFKIFDKISDQLKEFDYIYFLDGKVLPVLDIVDGILPTTEQGYVFVLHPKYFRLTSQELPYDRNLKSKSYMSYNEGKYYIFGGFNGGTSEAFLKLISTLKEWTDIDMANNVVPYKRGESMINRYFENMLETEKVKPLILTPEYAMPYYINDKYNQGKEFVDHTKMSILEKDF